MEMLSLFLIIAGVFGAAGIALAAAGAHTAPSAGLDSAANILLFHALAILGGTALLLQGMLSRQLALLALAAWVLGTILFSADDYELLWGSDFFLWPRRREELS